MSRTATHKPIRLARLLAVCAILMLAACGSTTSPSKASSPSSTGTTPSTGGSTPATGADTIIIKNFTFYPADLTVAPGATVTVTNQDSVTHTLTAQKATAFNTMDIAAGTSKTFTAPAAAGSYPYYCTIHQYMKATLTVS